MELIHLQSLSAYKEIIHFQTMREGGVSTAPYTSLNLSYRTGDNPCDVLQNRLLVAQEIGMPLDNFVIARQTHSANVRVITEEEKGYGAYFHNKDTLFDIDALVTNVPQIVLCVSIADCIPVLCYDPIKKVIAAIHAGWKGTAQSIVSQTVSRMVYHYGCRREDIIAAIGVGAGVCCYEVDKNVAFALREALHNQSHQDYLVEHSLEKYNVNLKMINKLQLIESGLIPSNIEVNPNCTICSPDKYFSFRNSNGVQFGQSLMGIAIR